MTQEKKETLYIKNLTLFFGIFLLFTDVVFLIFGILYDLPVIRYLIYAKLVFNTANIFFIIKKHYLLSTMIIYAAILAMMIVGVICLGTEPEFQVYALGMLVCVSYNSYLHKRILKTRLPLFLTVAIHVISFFAVYVYARTHAPLCQIPRGAMDFLIIFNTVASFCIVILYIYLYYHVAVKSEEKVESMAMRDNLTGLYNRHYLLAMMENRGPEGLKGAWLAILDIDDFKMVNDTYGHVCGDFILRRVAEILQEMCKDCVVCRWGGEEFIIYADHAEDYRDMLESLRGCGLRRKCLNMRKIGFM